MTKAELIDKIASGAGAEQVRCRKGTGFDAECC